MRLLVALVGPFLLVSILTAWLLLSFMPPVNNLGGYKVFDYLGATMLFFFIVMLLVGVNLSYYYLLSVGGLLVVLAWWFNKTPAPFIEVKLLKNLVFVRTIMVGLIINVVLLGGLFLLPLLLTNSYQLSSLKVGLIFFGASIFSSLASLFVGRLIPSYGNLTLIMRVQPSWL